MDLMMGDLLKNMRSSQIFSVCGSPEIKVERLPAAKGEAPKYQVELLGLDVFNPITMEVYHREGDDVPAWFLCTDYNDLCLPHHARRSSPAPAPGTTSRRSLKGDYDDSLWDHLAGTTSAPFEAGDHNADRRQGDRRPRQRVDGGAEASTRRSRRSPQPRKGRERTLRPAVCVRVTRKAEAEVMNSFEVAEPDPEFALRGAGPALVHPRGRGAGAAPGPPARRRLPAARPARAWDERRRHALPVQRLPRRLRAANWST